MVGHDGGGKLKDHHLDRPPGRSGPSQHHVLFWLDHDDDCMQLTTEHAVAYGSAEWSLITQGTVSDVTFTQRMSECLVCTGLVRHEGGLYCGLCGCARTETTELGFKLLMPTISCPMKKFKESEGIGTQSLAKIGGVKGNAIRILKHVFATLTGRPTVSDRGDGGAVDRRPEVGG